MQEKNTERKCLISPCLKAGALRHCSVKTSEHAEQVKLFQIASLHYRKHPELQFLFAIPNGAKLPWRRNKKGQRVSFEAIRLKSEGLRSGIPDIMLPVAKGGYHGLFIEMKVGRNKPTAEQAKVIEFLRAQNYMVEVCYSAENAWDVIQKYLHFSK